MKKSAKKPALTKRTTARKGAVSKPVQKKAAVKSAAKSTAKATRSVAKKPAVKSTRAVQKKRTVTSKAAQQKRTSVVRAKVKVQAKKALVPHEQNDFRPHLIRVHGLVAVLIIALLAQVVYGAITTGHLSVLGRVSNVEVSELVADTNKERVSGGLGELKVNAQLSDAAYKKAQNMFEEQYWAHVSPSGVQPWKWFGDTGYSYSYAGENLAKNYPTAEATVKAWMNSPTHRDNIMKSQYVDVGFAVVDGVMDGHDTTLVVALYGAPATVATVQYEEVAKESFPQATFAAPGVASAQSTPFTTFGSALSSLSPVTVAVLGLMAIVALVGAAAHHYRDQLPAAWKKSWRMNYGFYTFIGMIALGVLIIIATGGGSI